MDFTKFLLEIDQDEQKDTKMFDVVEKGVADLNLTLVGNDVYIIVDYGSKLGGMFVYILNNEDERYKSTKFPLSEMEYFYVGQFQYDVSNKKVVNIKEATLNRYLTEKDAITYIKGIQKSTF